MAWPTVWRAPPARGQSVLDAASRHGARYIALNITILTAVAFLSSSLALHAATITVFAAASLTDSLRAIATAYHAKAGDDIQFNFAASSVLQRQIEEGAPADIFFSADEAKMDALERKGLIEPSTRRVRLSNLLVIIIPNNSPVNIRSPKDLTLPGVKHIAIANPDAVPAGIYAREYLSSISLWSEVSPKIVPMENVRAALAVVESGDAEAGFVYKTDAAVSKKVRIAWTVPTGTGPKITYPVALIKESKQPATAKAFLDFLESVEAGKIFESFGFFLTPLTP